MVQSLKNEARRMLQRYRLHEGSLALVDRDEVEAVAWASIREIYQWTNAITMIGLTVNRTDLTVKFVTDEDREVELGPPVLDYGELNAKISLAVQIAQSPSARDRLSKSQEFTFGPLIVSAEGVRVIKPVGKRSIPRICKPRTAAWGEVAKLQIVKKSDRQSSYNELHITEGSQWWPFYTCKVADVPNFLVLTQILETFDHPIRDKT